MHFFRIPNNTCVIFNAGQSGVGQVQVLGIKKFRHPWAGEDLSLKIDERDQTIWICMLELLLFHSSQLKLKLAGLFFSKIHQMALGVV